MKMTKKAALILARRIVPVLNEYFPEIGASVDRTVLVLRNNPDNICSALQQCFYAALRERDRDRADEITDLITYVHWPEWVLPVREED